MLRDLQAGMCAALLGSSSEAMTAEICEDGVAANARLAIYRHHVFATLTDVLKTAYPVVCRLVDARFFGYAADRYIRRHPPAGPCLFEYGFMFADFLATFPPSRGLAYLPDVARLEWAMNVAEHAEDQASLDCRVLASVEATDAPRLTFAFDPSLTLLESPWPIDRIWRANQPGTSEASVDVTAGGVHLEVRRAGDEVVFRALDPAQWAFRRTLLAGQTLQEAASVAVAIAPACDLPGLLWALFDEGVLTMFTLSPLKERAS
jgi:hypothetical protein